MARERISARLFVETFHVEQRRVIVLPTTRSTHGCAPVSRRSRRGVLVRCDVPRGTTAGPGDHHAGRFTSGRVSARHAGRRRADLRDRDVVGPALGQRHGGPRTRAAPAARPASDPRRAPGARRPPANPRPRGIRCRSPRSTAVRRSCGRSPAPPARADPGDAPTSRPGPRRPRRDHRCRRAPRRPPRDRRPDGARLRRASPGLRAKRPRAPARGRLHRCRDRRPDRGSGPAHRWQPRRSRARGPGAGAIGPGPR